MNINVKFSIVIDKIIIYKKNFFDKNIKIHVDGIKGAIKIINKL